MASGALVVRKAEPVVRKLRGSKHAHHTFEYRDFRISRASVELLDGARQTMSHLFFDNVEQDTKYRKR